MATGDCVEEILYVAKKKKRKWKQKIKKQGEKEKKADSPAGNRTRVFRVTGGDTHHYTTEDLAEPQTLRIQWDHIHTQDATVSQRSITYKSLFQA